ncbi:MAG: hypothetical protein ABIG95_02610 [Candidatus Woesearchaeota archaeon]
MRYDILILGGGISGQMMAKRLNMEMPKKTITIVDKQEVKLHPFHLHRPIEDFPALSNLKSAVLKTNVWNGREIKEQPNLEDINNYSYKIFQCIQITNLYTQPTIKIYPISLPQLKAVMENKASQAIGDVTGIDISQKTTAITSLNDSLHKSWCLEYDYLINTVPLPNFLKLCGLDLSIPFQNFPFYTTMLNMNDTNMYQMIYITDMSNSLTRVTLMNSKLFLESTSATLSKDDYYFINDLYKGIFSAGQSISLRKLEPGRFRPIDNNLRKSIFYWLTVRHDIFCLGRYGAWTFKVANDVWDDTKQIIEWIYAKEQARIFENIVLKKEKSNV